jgi:hypothetical protein
MCRRNTKIYLAKKTEACIYFCRKILECIRWCAISFHQQLNHSWIGMLSVLAIALPIYWSERSACAALGCWHKRRWPLFKVFFSLFSWCCFLTTAIQNHRSGCRRVLHGLLSNKSRRIPIKKIITGTPPTPQNNPILTGKWGN